MNFPGDGLQGDIIGSVTNRIRQPTGDTMVGDLPNITLFEVSFDTETGVWEDGRVETYNTERLPADAGRFPF